jgi:adenine-specific DNA-methyltransferase
LNGDVKDLLPQLPSESVDLIVSSPPYNIGKAYESRTTTEQYLIFHGAVIKDLFRVLSKRGSICWQVGNRYDNKELMPLDYLFYPLFKGAGFHLRNRVIWHYEHGLHATRKFSGRYETLLWFTKSDTYTFNLDSVRVPAKYPGKRHYKGPKKGKPSGNPLGKNPSDVWSVVVQDWETGLWNIPNVKAHHPEKTIQPCQFPVELAERCVLAFTNPGDLVFDPFAGVGSAMIAAAMWGRRSIGAEEEDSYYSIILERLKKLKAGNLTLRKLGKPIYVPPKNLKVARPPEEWLRNNG